MKTYIAFLRGINVGGHRTIKMDDLKLLHQRMGHKNVLTYLQSGNVVFQCSERNKRALITGIENKYIEKFGFHIDVIILNVSEFTNIIRVCPISLTGNKEPKYLHTFLLSHTPDNNLVKKLMSYNGPEQKHVTKNVLYVYYPQGAGRSKLNLALVERTLKVSGTARNWNTITKLLDLTEK